MNIEPWKASIELQPVTRKKSILLTFETAGKIADALGLPMTTRKCTFTLDWSKNMFEATAQFHVTDEHGKLILEAVKNRGSSPD